MADEENAPPKPLFRTALLLLPLHIVFRAGEALLPFFLALWFGRSDQTDVYYFAWAVFAFAGSLVFSAFQDSALIPVLAEARAREPHMVPRILGSLLLHTWLLGGTLAALVGLGALGWFRARYGASADFALAASMVPLFTLALVAMATKTFFFAVLASEYRFYAQPVASALAMALNIGLVALLRSKLGVLAIPIGALAGESAAAGILAFVALSGGRVRIALNGSRPAAVRNFARLVANDVGGGAITRVNPIVDQLMAGLTGIVGGGTLLRYSGDVSSVPNSLLQASLLSVLLSHLSEDAAKLDYVRLRRTVLRAIGASTALLAAASVLLFAYRLPLLRLVFLHGEMHEPDVVAMAAIFPYHLVGIVPFGALLVLARAHVALKNTQTFLVLGAVNAALNAALNIVLVRFLDLRGLALSTSLVQVAIAFAFFCLFERKLTALGKANAGGSS